MPRPEDMKVCGQRVSLEGLAKAAKSVIAAGCLAALAKAASPDGGWPPDWDGLALSASPVQEAEEEAAKVEDD
jgi:hypothetical protein